MQRPFDATICTITRGSCWTKAAAGCHETRGSDYRLISISEPADLSAALATTLGICVVVRKRREIYLVDNVRVHFDQVEGLGDFLEFESVLDPTHDDRQGHAQVASLRDRFRDVLGEPIACGYADLARRRQCETTDAGPQGSNP